MNEPLPYVDQHHVLVDAPVDRVWAALRAFADRSLLTPGGSPFTRLLGTDPPSGFALTSVDPPTWLDLSGRHRFSSYRLLFEVDEAAEGSTWLTAHTSAVFPGLRGRVYRALVIHSRLHVAATRAMLRAVRRAAES